LKNIQYKKTKQTSLIAKLPVTTVPIILKRDKPIREVDVTMETRTKSKELSSNCKRCNSQSQLYIKSVTYVYMDQ